MSFCVLAGGFFERVGPGAHGRHHRVCEHDQRDMAAPAVPGSCFVVIETEFVFGGLEPLLDPPACAFYPHERLERRPLRAPGREISQIPIGRIAANQQAPLHVPVSVSPNPDA